MNTAIEAQKNDIGYMFLAAVGQAAAKAVHALFEKSQDILFDLLAVLIISFLQGLVLAFF